MAEKISRLDCALVFELKSIPKFSAYFAVQLVIGIELFLDMMKSTVDITPGKQFQK